MEVAFVCPLTGQGGDSRQAVILRSLIKTPAEHHRNKIFTGYSLRTHSVSLTGSSFGRPITDESTFCLFGFIILSTTPLLDRYLWHFKSNTLTLFSWKTREKRESFLSAVLVYNIITSYWMANCSHNYHFHHLPGWGEDSGEEGTEGTLCTFSACVCVAFARGNHGNMVHHTQMLVYLCECLCAL